MAASVLRAYSGASSATPNTFTTLVSAVPANRALVISKITMANVTGSSCQIYLTVGALSVAYAVTLAAGQVYTESGLVLLAGQTVLIASSTANSIQASVFGEEVDN